jgi:dihydroorotate dehydrogenase
MPDWFYRPVAQRVLFSLPDEAARGVALGVIGFLGKSVVGRSVIELMGHMKPDPRLAVSIYGARFTSAVGLGWRVDPERRASAGLACFGIGCLEFYDGGRRAVRRICGEALSDGKLTPLLTSVPALPIPALRRNHDASGREWLRFPDGQNLPVVAWDRAINGDVTDFTRGVVLQVGTPVDAQGWTVPAVGSAELAERVRAWRAVLAPDRTIIVSGGIGRPADAVDVITAGANLILIDAGMIFRGPGLVKRCNDALLARLPRTLESQQTVSVFRRAWFWMVALGVALGAGGLVALGLALSRVLLPYDESYLGLTSAELKRTLPQLFSFMAHDRATLAGVMIGLGWLYGCLGWCGARTHRHGARTAMIASALSGFASFFAFFGFGYFDTLHAFVAAMLFQFTVQIMVSEEGGAQPAPMPGDEEDQSWRRAQWGQLLWVTHAIGLLLAGVFILGIGITTVFVSEDLGFLCMTAQQAQELGARMIGVVAHDRASLGGMLLACGVAMLFPVLWCCRRGETWLWWAMAGLGLPAYGAALGIHFAVNYTDWRHIVPALIGLGLWLGGLVLTREYLGKEKAASEG